MKKFAMAAIAAAAMGAGVAQAYTVGTFSNGFVVPNVILNGATDTTAVGLINQSGKTQSVYWTFFDQDSNHGVDGCFVMTDKDYEPFIWSDKSGVNMAGKRGYLVFAASASTDCTDPTLNASGKISGNAFQVNTSTQDVAVTPVIDGNLTLARSTNLSTMGPDSLTGVAGAVSVTTASTSPTLNLRYYIDGQAGGTDTAIAVWSTGSQKGSHTVNIYDDKQQRQSVNFVLSHDEQDWFDPETISGRPAGFTDGFIEWQPVLKDKSGSAITGSVFSYSVISAPAFGAVQTVLGASY